MTKALKLRLILTVLCFVLPSLSLVPFGGIWLYQHGYATYWLAGAFIFVLLTFAAQLYLFRQLKPPPSKINTAATSAPLPEDEPESDWTPREVEAWSAVLRVADSVNLDELTSWNALFQLGVRTVEGVAHAVHPDERDPLWKFTAPEALTLFEGVSQNLRPMIEDNIPLGDQLTIGQILRIYRWRSAIEVAQRGYDVWRMVRLLNPAAAITQEVRERLSKEMYRWGREEIAGRLARGYVKEVGRAAIDLYGGRLKVSEAALAAHVSAASRRDHKIAQDDETADAAEPLRMLVAGQINAGKSSLVNLLLKQSKAPADVLPGPERFAAFHFEAPGLHHALLIDSPGLDQGEKELKELERAAEACDFLIWVINAARADRAVDAKALHHIRSFFAKNPNRRAPPILIALTHVDQLRPFQEWHPPYDLKDGASPKVASILSSREAVAEDLGVPVEAIIPVAFDAAKGIYNFDGFWAAVLDKAPEADAARRIRTLSELKSRLDWQKLGGQTLNAGRLLAKTFLKDKT